MDSLQTLTFITLGALLGAAGQLVRAIVGIKKEIDQAKAAGKTAQDWFDAKELYMSIALGAVAGIGAAISVYQSDVQLSKDMLIGFLAAGYAGADFIGGLMQKWLPKSPANP
jgi:hypothetical protein